MYSKQSCNLISFTRNHWKFSLFYCNSCNSNDCSIEIFRACRNGQTMNARVNCKLLFSVGKKKKKKNITTTTTRTNISNVWKCNKHEQSRRHFWSATLAAYSCNKKYDHCVAEGVDDTPPIFAALQRANCYACNINNGKRTQANASPIMCRQHLFYGQCGILTLWHRRLQRFVATCDYGEM